METIKLGIYSHYKDSNKKYEVLGIANHSETLEKLVIYRAMYNSEEFGNNAIWARPLLNFKEYVIVNGNKVPRFKYIGK